ncbi:MAG TPA: 2OG-Fe(II) oxygenase [Wenzhouxiangellaceae bacterium]|nr:2OG-Fe(II) oxygenase [Wenzhouxiangellaceae bacterium]
MAAKRIAGDTESEPMEIDNWIDEAADALAEHGWFCRDDAVSPALIAALSDDLAKLMEDDRLKRAGIGRERDFQVDRDIRRDWIFWLNRQRPVQAEFLGLAEQLRLALNRRLFLALFEFEAHVALYPPGAFYRRHFDSFRGAANRMVSLVFYLNLDWREGDGGELVLYEPGGQEEMARIAPRAGTLALFMSEEIEHEVLPTRTDRASIAGWFRLNNSTAEYLDPPR